jgi:hypothetical protein
MNERAQSLKEVQVVDRMTVRLVASQPSVSLVSGLPKVSSSTAGGR